MTIERITELQEAHGLKQMQDLINSGDAWKMEGSYGRAAMANLDSGACMLPTESHWDYWGNLVPSRDMLQDGTKGTLQNSINFWTAVEDGTIDLGGDEYGDDD